jgi:hypothetical protein
MFRDATKWQPRYHYRGLVVSAKKVLADARELALQEIRDRHYRRNVRMRVVLVRDLEAKYGAHHRSYEHQ